MQNVHTLTPAEMAATQRKGPPPEYNDPGPITPESLRDEPQSSYQSETGQSQSGYALPNIFICGPSGSGKSTCLRNLDGARTIILSTELRPLPFPGSRSRFPMMMRVSSLAQFRRVFAKALASTSADTVVLDSFTSLAEFVYAQFVRDAEKSKDGTFEAWLHYRDCLHAILVQAKQSPKQVIFTGIDMPLQDDQKRITRSIDVQGGLKGKVEKEFDVVFFTKVRDLDITDKTKERYFLCTNSDGHNTAKSPMGLFEQLYIPNDLAAVTGQINHYFDS